MLVKTTETLMELNKRGYAHRDLKPDNFFLINPYLVALGDLSMCISKDKKDSAGVGTLLYMAPDFLNYYHIPWKVDTFALGIVFYEIIT